MAGEDSPVKPRAKLLSGLDADRVLSESMPLWAKVAFLSTNLPYWMIVIIAGQDWIRLSLLGESTADIHVCGHPGLYFIGGLFVALSSTVMHGSQLRLGSCLCCAHPERSEQFHELEWQKVFKKVDISCALMALVTCIYCHAWKDLVATFAVALPLFVAGVFLKRLSYHYLYMLVHGSWHVVTAMLVWDAVLK